MWKHLRLMCFTCLFLFLLTLLWVTSKKNHRQDHSHRAYPLFSWRCGFKSYIQALVNLWSVDFHIHYKIKLWFHSLHVDMYFCQLGWRGCSFPTVYSWLLCQKIIDHISIGILGIFCSIHLYILFHWSIFCFIAIPYCFNDSCFIFPPLLHFFIHLRRPFYQNKI